MRWMVWRHVVDHHHTRPHTTQSATYVMVDATAFALTPSDSAMLCDNCASMLVECSILTVTRVVYDV